MTEEHDETADIVADAVAQERAAVVAWLREAATKWGWGAPGAATALNHAADIIERGEHRREETE